MGPVYSDHPILIDHPASHGGLILNAEHPDGIITSAEFKTGFMNRGAEEIFSVRDFKQGAMLANRHCWSAPSSGEFPYVLAVEDLLGLTPSDRAKILRVIILELDRAASHLLFLEQIQAREEILKLLERITGSRMHHHFITVGGVHHDFDLELVHTETIKILNFMKPQLHHASQENVGIAPSAVLLSHGASGIILRASGIPLDLRKQTAGYSELNFESLIRSNGDITDRLELLFQEARLALELVIKAVECAPSGEISERLPKNLRLPKGESYAAIEGALGISGVTLISDGGLSPQRIRLRTASEGNLSALAEILVGMNIQDLEPMLKSWPFLIGDLDR